MKSRQELKLRALQSLGVVGAGQAASAEDDAAIEAEIEPLMDNLSARNIYQWGDPDEFDDAAFIHLAKLLANSRAAEFGVPFSEEARLYHEARLRELRPANDEVPPQTAVYY